VVHKKEKIQTDISDHRAAMLGISNLATEMSDSLTVYERAIVDETRAAAAEEVHGEDHRGLVEEVRACMKELKGFAKEGDDVRKRDVDKANSSARSSMEEAEDKRRQEAAAAAVPSEKTLAVSEYSLSGSKGSKAVKSAAVGGKEAWSPVDEGTNPNSAVARDAHLLVSLRRARSVTSLVLQGGQVTVRTAAAPTPTPATRQSFSSAPAKVALDTLTLPSGLSLSSCRGEVEVTRDAMADVIDWVTLLKKNPPEKFLKRPPVRFLFDLIKYVQDVAHVFPENIAQANWEEIGNSKQGKLDFMATVSDTRFEVLV